ncbi:AraC family transcriptional regulator [Flavihumibacter fluvii]|uniref:AraC family transcriptional regulator n=1 Tax=Flavihumibacter fluvii TaxID=2838157 RepID=UPI001BDE0C75|nr:AraC family transcriptional regulator [Flavihumibacter fluvii]ULQ52641.1 AraC family transcriptional regulator [Flavihumibacter fluvii]
MKPVLEHLPREAGESFVVKYFQYPFFPTPWHFHPEYELVLVTESTGKRFIGDSINNFGPGDLALIGPYLPHFYRNDEQYHYPDSCLMAKSIVVHFLPESFGTSFLDLPEMKKIRQLLINSKKGIAFTGKTNTLASEKIWQLTRLKGIQRWLLLVEILQLMAGTRDYNYISNDLVEGINKTESDRMDAVLNFVLENFQNEIRLADVASLVNMAENSFSRYFSQRTRKTFTSYVNEIRLSHASKLLIETNESISEISFRCGFNNRSNFNRQFSQMHGRSPLNYRKLYMQLV